jgi:acyl-coenzyme A synthetase/AMP-(fatty) acid ligase
VYSIVDRVKELIKYKGYQGRSFEMSLYSWFTDHLLVPPAELEALLLSYDKVADTAVIGINSASQGTELPRAYVVPKAPLESLDSAQRAALSKEIADWISTRVASYKRLRGGVILIEAIPKSPSGKILRKDLRVLAEKDNTAERAKL